MANSNTEMPGPVRGFSTKHGVASKRRRVAVASHGSSHLICNPPCGIHREQPVRVRPFRDGRPSSCSKEKASFARSPLITVLRVNRIASIKLKLIVGDTNGGGGLGFKMHFNPASLLVPSDLVAESVDVKLGAELASHPSEQVQVELRRHASCIIVGGHQNPFVLNRSMPINSIAPWPNVSLILRSRSTASASEALPNVEPGKKPRRGRSLGSLGSTTGRKKSASNGSIGTPVTRFLISATDRRRNSPEMSIGTYADNPDNIIYLQQQDLALSARRIVLRKLRDELEQFRVTGVVEPARWNIPWSAAEALQHVV